jgi:5-methylcytosine-specific restriction endonuclease McrA
MMTKRQRIFQKYNGLCAYSGTPLEDDWQIDHLHPVVRHPWTGQMQRPERDTEDNLVPCQRAINLYKHSEPLESFRTNLLGRLHQRLPKYPRSGAGMARRQRMEKIAAYFGITPDNPFNGKFYFETL